jgi:hypothetical protein
MIEGIEVLMRHWADQIGRNSVAHGCSSAASPLAGLIEWGGAPPRGEPGSRILDGGCALDHRASEVQACIDAVERQGEKCEHLVRLARLRYLDHAGCGPRSVEMQMVALGMKPGADRTYRNWVHRLHELILRELERRHAGTLEAIKRVPRALAKGRRDSKRRANQHAKQLLSH